MAKTIFESDVGSVIIGGTDYTGEVREISITAPGRDVTEIRTFGGGCSGFPVPPAGPVSTTITAVMSDADLPFLVGSPTPNDYGAATGTKYPIVYTWVDTSDVSGTAIQFKMSSAWLTNMPSVRQAHDGYVEVQIEAKCLTKEFFPESTSDRATTPLST